MKNIIIIFSILFCLTTYSQTKFFIHHEAETYVSNTKTIAILPLRVDVRLRPRQLKKYTAEQIKEINKSESLNVQSAMYSWFLTREQRGELLVGVQNPSTTNAILKKNGIDIYSTADYTAKELGELLGVETVITGSLKTSKPMSDAGAVGLFLLTGGEFATNTALLNMSFTNTSDNKVVVNYNKKIKRSIGSDTQSVINALMRKISRRMPYTK
jgi:hypothetical protein